MFSLQRPKKNISHRLMLPCPKKKEHDSQNSEQLGKVKKIRKQIIKNQKLFERWLKWWKLSRRIFKLTLVEHSTEYIHFP